MGGGSGFGGREAAQRLAVRMAGSLQGPCEVQSWGGAGVAPGCRAALRCTGPRAGMRDNNTTHLANNPDVLQPEWAVLLVWLAAQILGCWLAAGGRQQVESREWNGPRFVFSRGRTVVLSHWVFILYKVPNAGRMDAAGRTGDWSQAGWTGFAAARTRYYLSS